MRVREIIAFEETSTMHSRQKVWAQSSDTGSKNTMKHTAQWNSFSSAIIIPQKRKMSKKGRKKERRRS